MATQQRDIYANHTLNKLKDVFLTITIGNDQIGGSKVKWSDSETYLVQGQVIGLALGKGSMLIGKKLLITTRFYDRNDYTNNISGMYDFNNGEEPIHIFYDTVENDKDFFVFNIEFTFK